MSATHLRIPEDRWTGLESLIVRLGLECRRLQRENHALTHAIAEREQEIAQLRADHHAHGESQRDVAQLLSAREHIQERIDDLIARLDLAEVPLLTQAGAEE